MDELDKIQIVDALRKVTDPASGQDIITMRMAENLQTQGNQVSFRLILPSLQNKHKEELTFACMEAIKSIYPQADVHVHATVRNPEAPSPSSPLPHVKNIIAIASGKGGVGKSTIATNLALGLQNLGAKVGLLDADIYGPSIPTMLGLQGKRPQIREVYKEPKIVPLEAYGLPVMSIGFIIEPEQAVVLRGPRLAGVLKQFLQDCLWPALDYLIIDLPPGTGDVQLTLVQTVPVTGAVIVTTPQEVAVADAIKAMNMFLLPSVNVPILGIVENMAWFSPKELPGNKYYIFGEGGGKRLVKMSNSVLLGQAPLIMGIRESGDRGKPSILSEQEPEIREIFMEIAKNVARQVAVRNEYIDPTSIVGMQTGEKR